MLIYKFDSFLPNTRKGLVPIRLLFSIFLDRTQQPLAKDLQGFAVVA